MTTGSILVEYLIQILADDEKSLVEVRRRSAKILDSRRISVSWSLSGRCMGPDVLKSDPELWYYRDYGVQEHRL